MVSKKTSPKAARQSQVHFQHALDDQTFRQMFEGHSEVMLLIEPQTGDILDANQAAVNFYGYSKLKLCGMSIYEINTLPPEQVAAERHKAFTEERNYFVFPHWLASGEVRIVEVHSSPIALQEKQVLFSIIHDITERKQVEEDLRESQKKFRALAENIPNVVYQCRNDSRYTLLYINSQVEELTGYPPQAFLKDGLTFFDLYHPDDLPAIRVPLTIQPAINHGAFHITYRIRHRSGEWRWVDEWGTGALADTAASEPVAVCEGANYLAVCDATRGPDVVYAKAIGNGIRAVISGKQTVFSLEYPCDFFVGSRIEKRWFNAKVTCFAGDGPIRIVVAHENITARKQAEESLQHQNIYLSTLHQITLDLLNHRNMDELLQSIVDRAVILLDAPFGELMLEKDGELIVQTCTQNQASLVGERNGRAKAKLSWLAFDTKQHVVLEDYSTYEHYQSIYAEYALHAVAEFPILVRDKCIGVLSLGRVEPEYIFTEMQVKNGSLFAQLVALVLDNAQLFFDAKHEIAERKQAESELRLAKETLEIAHQKLG